MDDMLKEAIRLRKLGFAIHWLRPRSKIPVGDDWANAPVMDEKTLKTTYRTGYNVGFRPGRWSVVQNKEYLPFEKAFVDFRVPVPEKQT